MARSVSLLLTESVDNLGIVGDVVNVKLGYARNFLLPRGFATTPSDEAVAALAERRAEAEKELSRLRSDRQELVQRLNGHEVTVQRACNDQGNLYASVTQQDLANILVEEGFAVRPRDIRLPGGIKRLDTYEVLIKFDQDLESSIKLWVVPDRELDTDDDREEMEFDNEGNLIDKPKAARRPRPAEDEAAEAPEAAAPAEG